MPRIKARTPEGNKVLILNEFGDIFGPVYECDTDEGWIEFYLIWPNGKVMVDRKDQKLVSHRLYTSFKVVDRITKEVKHSVKWNMNREVPPIIESFETE